LLVATQVSGAAEYTDQCYQAAKFLAGQLRQSGCDEVELVGTGGSSHIRSAACPVGRPALEVAYLSTPSHPSNGPHATPTLAMRGECLRQIGVGDGLNPLVLGRIITDPAKPTVFVYGHYDVVPASVRPPGRIVARGQPNPLVRQAKFNFR